MSPYDIGIARFASRYTNNVSEIGRFYWKAMKNSCSSCTNVPDYRVTLDVNSFGRRIGLVTNNTTQDCDAYIRENLHTRVSNCFDVLSSHPL